MNLFHESVPHFIRMLTNLQRWLDEAEQFAESNGVDPETYVDARLHRDQFPLARQIQSACDAAKFTAARLSGQEAPQNPDTESTLAELRERIQTTLVYLNGFAADDFEGNNETKLFLTFLQGGFVTAEDYLREFATANFYFHITTAYAILRHHDVPLGKRTFIGSMNVQAPSA